VVTNKSAAAIAKPKSMWKRKVKFNFVPLFKSLGKAAAHTVSLKFDELGADAADAVASLGLEVPPEELAFVLLQRALFDALLSLTKESASYLGVDPHVYAKLSEELESALVAVETRFDEDFFKNPKKLAVLVKIEEAYSQWLCDCGVSPKNSVVIARRFKSYFVYSLANEWRKNSKSYLSLVESVSSPFAGAEEYEKGWQNYFSFLEKRINENTFDEPFSLAQIYVPLNAYFIEQPKDENKSRGAFQRKFKQVVVNLEDELCSWLSSGCKTDALRVISGGPGSGKSSFTKVFCAKVAGEGRVKPIYIPLHLIDPTKDVSNEVEKFVKDEGLLGFNPLDPERREENLLIVFDGLDELASQGKVAEQVARDFVQAVERMVERRNLGQQPIFVILSGRELVVQANETEFRRPKQVLSLLPYFVPLRDRGEYIDDMKLLDVDSRDEWWKKYGELTGANYPELPAQLKSIELDEITAQPLLNYLVALSYSRGKLNFERQLNLNSVYGDLIGAVHDRGYEKTRTYGPIRHIKQKDFIRVLEEIGLAAWHSSDGRSTSVGDIMRHCKQSGLETMLATFKEGAEAGVTKLLAAFFFRRNGQHSGDDAAFVFTHKSFGEYLTSARLIRGIEKIVMHRHRRAIDPDDGFDLGDALGHWAGLAGPAPITGYIQKFLIREMEQREKDELIEWQKVLTELASVAIDRHFPMEKIGAHAFYNSFRSDVNASVALFVALNACSRACGITAKLSFSDATSFGTFLRRVVPQRLGPQNPPLYSALSYLDFTGQCMDLVDLWQADLNHTVWLRAKVNLANFGFNDISNAVFYGAVLNGSRFQGKTMRNIDFAKADLKDVDFARATISDSKFLFANLVATDFEDAELIDCDFGDAIFEKSNINKIKSISGCNFDGVVISRSEKSIINWFNTQKERGNIKGSLKILDDLHAERLSRARQEAALRESSKS